LTPKDLDHIRPINSSVNAIPSYKCEWLDGFVLHP
jgi:hypothetical protein